MAFYVALATRHAGPTSKATVLEYGVGNGRIALPLARHGVNVVGVDQSAPMLADLQERLDTEGPEVARRVTMKRGDMRRLALGRRFPLVLCPFNTALHLYTREDVERFLARARAHLAPGGLFVGDISVPVPRDLARDPNKAHHAPRFRHPGTGDVVRYWEHFDYDRARQVLFVSMMFEPVARPDAGWMAPLAHRQFYPQEWEALLHYNGFDLVKTEGDFAGSPFDRSSESFVWYARASKKKARR